MTKVDEEDDVHVEDDSRRRCCRPCFIDVDAVDVLTSRDVDAVDVDAVVVSFFGFRRPCFFRAATRVVAALRASLVSCRLGRAEWRSCSWPYFFLNFFLTSPTTSCTFFLLPTNSWVDAVQLECEVLPSGAQHRRPSASPFEHQRAQVGVSNKSVPGT